MASWRDDATEEAQDDLDELVNAAMVFAQRMLYRHREFYPYAVALEANGETRMLGANEGDNYPSSTDLLRGLIDGLRNQRDALIAAAVVADVRVADSDAIRVECEHRDGHAIVVLLPYKKYRLKRGVEYGELSASAGEPKIWTTA